jgi:protoheme IX farnesyltransferase
VSTQIATHVEVTPVSLTARLSDYLQLTRPKIALMVLVTAGLGMLLAGGLPDAAAVALTLIGTGLVTAGASAGNQLIERRSDAIMTRTESRPLPAGRLGVSEVLTFTAVSTFLGLVCLLMLPSPAAAIVAGTSFVLYVFVYTPAKRKTWLNTFIGAVPGALPPLIGYAAARGTLTLESAPLFAILFFWQIPHFLAIAWIHRHDYQEAKLKMLPVFDPTGRRTARVMIANTLFLIAVSLWPMAFGAGWLYALGAAALGLAFLALTWRFRADKTIATARAVLRMSLLYLPGVLLMLFVDRMI